MPEEPPPISGGGLTFQGWARFPLAAGVGMVALDTLPSIGLRGNGAAGLSFLAVLVSARLVHDWPSIRAGYSMRLPAAVGLLFAVSCTDRILCASCGGQHSQLRVVPSAPDVLLDSATVGSTTRQLKPVEVINDGGGLLRWAATIKHSSPWLSLEPDTGTAGLPPTLRVSLDPGGLGMGAYRDTVIVRDRTGAGTVEVPVDFRIIP